MFLHGINVTVGCDFVEDYLGSITFVSKFYCMLGVYKIRLFQSGAFNIEMLYLLIIRRVLCYLPLEVFTLAAPPI